MVGHSLEAPMAAFTSEAGWPVRARQRLRSSRAGEDSGKSRTMSKASPQRERSEVVSGCSSAPIRLKPAVPLHLFGELLSFLKRY